MSTLSTPLSTDQKTNLLQEILIENVVLPNQKRMDFVLTYQLFGQPLHKAPIILVNHALTGNSEVAGEKGWWKKLVGDHQIVDTTRFSVIAFDIPGNGYDQKEAHLLSDYTLLNTQTVAALFWKGLEKLGISQLFAVLGSSLGGGVSWEMVFLKPKSITHLIPIATNLKASDWLIGNVLVQERILNHSSHPIEDARIHAMHLYRNPASFKEKFKGAYKTEENQYAIESWLKYHGSVLEQRFTLAAYKEMNYLLKTIGEWITSEDLREFAQSTTSHIHCIVVDSDGLFTKAEQEHTFQTLKRYGAPISYQEIQSIHGHDAFLIEYEQLNALLKPIFENL